jgi:cupin 2 domain-containing protein
MKNSNIFSNIPNEIQEEIFEEIISKENLKVQRIISYGHTTDKFDWYDQESDEWVIILEGEAILCFENQEEIVLKKGDYLNIPAHTKHRVSWTPPHTKTIWLAIHY